MADKATDKASTDSLPEDASTATRGSIEESPSSQTEVNQGVKDGESLHDYLKRTTVVEGDEGKAEQSSAEEADIGGPLGQEDGKAKTDTNEPEEGSEKGAEKDQTTEETDKEKQEDGEGEDKGPVPYERFEEKVRSEQAVKAELEKVQPELTGYRNIVAFCDENGIDAQSHDQALQILAYMKSDPAKALELLQPMVDNLKTITGGKLPSDLQQKVDDNLISLDDAKEMAQLRAKVSLGEQGLKRERKSAEQRAVEQFQRQCAEAAGNWEKAKRASDPDYKPSSDGSHGKWEMVRDRYLALLNQTKMEGSRMSYVNPISTVKDMSALLDRAYQDIDKTFKSSFSKKPATRKFLSSNGSAVGGDKGSFTEAKTMSEGVRQYLAERRR